MASRSHFFPALLTALAVSSTLSGCAVTTGNDVTSILSVCAPDKREAVFEVIPVRKGLSTFELTGTISDTAALEACRKELKAAGIATIDATRKLPDATATAPWALVTVPVAELNNRDGFLGGTTTQLTSGTPVRILRKARWHQVQTPDGYTAWVHAMQLRLMTEEELSAWNASPRVIVTALQTTLTTREGATPLFPAGGILAVLSDKTESKTTKGKLAVRTAGGIVGFVNAADVMMLADFQNTNAKLRENEAALRASIVKTALQLTGRPYLWGGTSTFAADCSGFTQTVWKMHDLIISRDADMQAKAQTTQTPAPGDTLTFGTEKYVSHVAVYAGDTAGGKSRFIHSLGDVHVGALDSADSLFDAYNTGRYTGAVNPLTTPCLMTTKDHPFYQSPPQQMKPCRRMH